jgi:hypothetical protein
MAQTEKPILLAEEVERSAQIKGLLAQIENEKIPEQLLLLAQELQAALNLRKARDGKKAAH